MLTKSHFNFTSNKTNININPIQHLKLKHHLKQIQFKTRNFKINISKLMMMMTMMMMIKIKMRKDKED